MKKIWIIILPLCTLIPLISAGQVFYNNSLLYVGDNALLNLPSHLENDNFIINNGVMSLEGNLVNRNVYQGAGTLVLSGSSDQEVINNNQPINHLAVLNGGRKLLKQNLLITGSLLLEEGYVFTDALNSKLTLGRSAEITGGSQVSFVEGPLFHEGVGYKFYPIGKDGNYRPAELLDIKGIDPVTGMQVVSGVPSVEVDETNEVQISTVRHWQIIDASGSYTGSPVKIYFGADDLQDFSTAVLLSGSAFDKLFTVIDEVTLSGTLESGDITTREDVTEPYLILANADRNGLTKAFYFSNTLDYDASDPQNRFVKIHGSDMVEEGFLFAVFNRLGIKIFETYSLNQMTDKGWNGFTDNGNKLAQGTYPYILKIRKNNGNTAIYNGVITIM